MSEICRECLEKVMGEKYTDAQVMIDYEELDICEECGEVKPCVIRFRRPIERFFYHLFHLFGGKR